MFIRAPKRTSCPYALIAAVVIQGELFNGNFLKHRAFSGLLDLHKPLNDVEKIANLLRKCGNAKALFEGKRLHQQIVSQGLGQDRYLGNILIQMYGRCGSLKDAREVFDNMWRRNSFTWNMMLSAYTQKGKLKEALEIFEEMQEKDQVAWNTIVSALAQEGQIQEAIRLFKMMPQKDVVSWNTMIAAYVQHGHLNKARLLFEQMPERDVVSWTTMVVAYAREGHFENARRFFQEMPEQDLVSRTAMIEVYAQLGELKEAAQLFRGLPQKDVVSCTAMISVYAELGELIEAIHLFEHMPYRNGISWTALIAAYAQHGKSKEALQRFQEMHLDGLVPDKVTFGSAICACSHGGLVDEGCHYFASMSTFYCITTGLPHVNSLIDILGRRGLLEEAESLLNNMLFHADPASWIALTSSCRIYDVDEHSPNEEQTVFLCR